MKIAVLFSGGPAPGGHEVLYSLRKHLPSKYLLYGVMDGLRGLLEGRFSLLTEEILSSYRLRGGFDLLGTSRFKLPKGEELDRILDQIKKEAFNAIFFIGGDDTATNAFYLASHTPCQIIHIPKTIDGDLPVRSFGFDTAVSRFAQWISWLKADARSLRKYYYVVKLMGRDASHLTLHSALRSEPTFAWITEELIANNTSIDEVIDHLFKLFKKRNKTYGTLLIPEGLGLAFPTWIEQAQKDAHGNPSLSAIDIHMRLFEEAAKRGPLPEVRFFHYGYEVRSSPPNESDLAYAGTLGKRGVEAFLSGATGVMVTDQGFQKLSHWMEEDPVRGFVFKKKLVSLEEEAFLSFQEKRQEWLHLD